MKPSSMRVAFLILFLFLSILFLSMTWPFAKAAFLAFTLAIIFLPLQRFIKNRCKMPRYVASSISTIIVATCVILPVAVLLSIFVTQIISFLQMVTSHAEGATFSDTLQPLLVALRDAIERIAGSAPSVEDLRSALIELVKNAGVKFYEFSPKMLTTTFSILLNFLFMLVFLIVFFAEGDILMDWLLEATPFSADHRRELTTEVRMAITSSIFAAVVIAILQGILLGVGFWVAGFDDPTRWGFVAVILSFIPVVGASSCYIVSSIVLFSTGHSYGAIGFLAYGFCIVSSVDNIVRSILVRGTTRMHPVLLFVTLIGAVRLVGPIGILVGPVLLSIFLASLRIYRREFAMLES